MDVSWNSSKQRITSPQPWTPQAHSSYSGYRSYPKSKTARNTTWPTLYVTCRTRENLFFALAWLHSFQDPEGLIARWQEILAEYHYKLEHRPGSKHGNADTLSRIPQDPPRVATIKLSDGRASEWAETQTKDPYLRLNYDKLIHDTDKRSVTPRREPMKAIEEEPTGFNMRKVYTAMKCLDSDQ
ncbi:unnamed protein product [Hymenolepis diminuta]|uniref:Reverse transcriptase RNase H-like domain-containing protein n=1 Tax=Hymenolepis diminuta TaxID=6216 RepID=A0A564ZC36_HYMDI|nr:unnamed protein product [Hymenolepis diminuta]